MITYTEGSRRFNYRVAGVFIESNHVLVHRAEPDDFWTLPGGRGELGEEAAATLRREMTEELGEMVRVERLLWVVESFFTYDAKDYHELAFYWLATLPAGSALRDTRRPFVGREASVKLHFRWAPIETLVGETLHPAFLREGLKALPATPRHLVVRG